MVGKSSGSGKQNKRSSTDYYEDNLKSIADLTKIKISK